MCMKKNDIKQIRSAPGHPATNGEAKCFVQTFKRALKAGKRDGAGFLADKVVKISICVPYYTSCYHWGFPAELFVKRRLRTRLDLLHPVN